MRKLYEAPGNWIYEAKTRTRNVRYGKHACSNKEQIGWDMLRLIERFENHPKLSGINTFKDMARVFNEQCEIDDGKVKIRKHPGGGGVTFAILSKVRLKKIFIYWTIMICELY